MKNGGFEDLGVLRAAAGYAQDYLAGLDDRSVAARVSLTELRARLGKPLAESGVAAETVIKDLVADAGDGLVASGAGRFFGWVIGGTLPAAMAADWLTAAWDQNATIYACSPAASIAEEVAGEWLKQLLGLPAQASFAFVTGCQMAHVTCLAAARGTLLRKHGWDAAAQGLSGAPRIRILANEMRHGSIERAAGFLGLGRNAIEPLATDDMGQVECDALVKALGRSEPTILVLQAGDIATGAFDKFSELIPLAKKAGVWVHIDGAFGLWARASAQFRHLAAGVEQADSWATDGHKILNTPFDCGYAFIASAEEHRAAFSLRATYLTHDDNARDAIDWTPDWSRRARGFSTYAALRSLGRIGVAKLFDGYCEQTRALVQGLRDLPGVELVSAPLINQALIRFPDSNPRASHTDHDRRTDAVIEAINATGEAFFSGSTWRGRRVMRISVCNWRTDTSDVARAVDAARRVLLWNGDGSPVESVTTPETQRVRL